MGRSPCCSKVGLTRGPWSTKEDILLTNFIHENGEGQWRSLPKKAGLLRCGKSCRLRWMNYLRPGIVRGNISQDEEDLIVRLHRLLGNRWSLIAGRLPGRTDNEIKNYWNTHLLKKLNNAGIPAAAKKEKKTKQKKTGPTEGLVTGGQGEIIKKRQEEEEEDLPVAKTKVYLPKPIRISSAFPRTDSLDSLGSGGSWSREAPEVWPIFEMDDGGYAGEDDFLGGYCVLPLPHSSSSGGDVIMLDQVYDEYLQLLS